MKLAVALAAWLALGLPSAAACWRAGRPELGLALLPFSGALAILLPVAFAPWLGGSFAHWGLRAACASLGVGLALALLARGAGLGVHQLSLPLAAILACLLPAVAIGLLRVLPPALAACIALAPLAVPAVALRQFSGYADPLLVVCATAGFAWSAAAAIRGDAALGAAGAVALACAASLKNEGVLWLLAVALACAPLAWLARREPGAACAAALRAGLPGLALFAGWRAVAAGLGVADTLPAGLRADLIGERVGVVASALLALTPPLVFALLAACAAATWLRLQGPPATRALQGLALWLAPAVYLVGILTIYLLTPHDVRWHLSTSLARTSFALAPTCLVAAVLARELARAADAGTRREPRP